MNKKDEHAKNEEEDGPVEILFFKSETCAFCPRAEEVLRETIEEFGAEMFKLKIFNVTKEPEIAEEYGIFALPTIIIGGMSVTGIPEPEMILKMILGSKLRKGVDMSDDKI